MRVPREKLILWSVCALYERALEASDEPMKPDFAIKAVLALIVALGCDRQHTDGYWRAMRAEHTGGQAAYVRGTALRTQLEAIKRSLGVDSPLFTHDVGETMNGPSRPNLQYDRTIEHLRRERQKEAAKLREDRDCGWL